MSASDNKQGVSLIGMLLDLSDQIEFAASWSSEMIIASSYCLMI